MSKPKVLILTNMFPKNGSQKGIFVKEIFDALNINGGVFVDVLSIDVFCRSYLNYLFSWVYLFNKIKAVHFDLINVHFGLSIIPVLILWPYIKIKDIKIIITFHGSDLMGNRLVNFISNLGLLMANRGIVVSDKMISFLWLCNRNKIDVVPCGVHDMFNYKDRDLWNKDKVLKIIFPSNPERVEKNYHLFDLVVKSLVKHGILVEVIIFKDLSRNDILTNLYSSNVLFLSSLREGSPQVIKEAILTGLPVISTDVGDVKQILFGLPENQTFISNQPEDISEWIVEKFIGGSIAMELVKCKFNIYSNSVLINRLRCIFLEEIKK